MTQFASLNATALPKWDKEFAHRGANSLRVDPLWRLGKTENSSVASLGFIHFNSLTTEKQTTKFSSANFQKY